MERIQKLENEFGEKRNQFAAADKEFDALIAKRDVEHITKWRKTKQPHYAMLSGQIARLKANILMERMWAGLMEEL